jgi:hypothetical protein
MIGFTPPRLGRGHLLFGAGMVAIGLVLIFDTFSAAGTGQRWFFQHSYPEVEWAWGLAALAVAVVWGRRQRWLVDRAQHRLALVPPNLERDQSAVTTARRRDEAGISGRSL